MDSALLVNGDGFTVGETSELNLVERGAVEPVADPGAPEREKPGFPSFPPEIKGRILEQLRYNEVFRLRALSKDFKSLLSSQEFIQTLSIREQSTLTACYFFIEESVLNWAGFDILTNNWIKLPPLSFLPTGCDPDPELFKQFLFCTAAGLVCVNFSKLQHEERLVIFNLLTQAFRELPPLLHRRNPVLLHLLVAAPNSYQILAAGSSSSSEEHLSTISELYDSRTGHWERVGDLPGPPFSVNDYQSGVSLNGKIYCIGFITDRDQIVRGLLVFNIETRTWSTKRATNTFPSSAILQLIENGGELLLLSERENGRVTEHWVDRVQWIDTDSFELVNVVKIRSGGRSLEVYPESALAPFGEGRVCLYNTVDHTGHIVELGDRDGSEALPAGEVVDAGEVRSEALPALPERGFTGQLGFFSLNPLSFTVEPRFTSQV